MGPRGRGLALFALPAALAGCVTPTGGGGHLDNGVAAGAAAAAVASADGSQYLIIDCLLPPQMISQGESSIRFTPSRPAKLSAKLCAQQGGARKAGLDAWFKLAQSGNAEAQVYLGEMYENGTGGVEQDTRKAIEWYQKSAAQKNARAISNLALLYANGAPGIAKAPEKAAALVEQSAEAVGVDTRNLVVEPIAPTAGRRPGPGPSATNVGGSELRQFPFGEYHALLIGNNDYQNLPKLRSPVNEIEVIGRLLEGRFGFHVTRLRNGTRDQILHQLDELGATLKPTDNLLVYYSGHGAEAPVSHEGYWIPVDGEAPARPNEPFRTRLWLSSADLRTKLAEMAPRHVLVVSDSCYSARFLQFRGVFTAGSAAVSAAYLNNFGKLYAAKSRTALTSGGLAPVVEPNDGSNLSLFAKAFAHYLDAQKAPLPSVQVFSNIQEEVIRSTSELGYAQEPQWGPISGSGHESGDFWFRPK